MEGRPSLLFYLSLSLSLSFFRRTWDRECEFKLTFFVWLHQKGFVILYLGGNEINKKRGRRGREEIPQSMKRVARLCMEHLISPNALSYCECWLGEERE